MMDDQDFGTRDKRGHWRPHQALKVGPLLDFPIHGARILRWLPSYFLPWNAAFFGLACLLWFWLTPPRDVLETLNFGWIAWLFVRNTILVFLVFGALELRLYILRKQANRFKYNPRFPADAASDVFWFNSQIKDNMMRTFLSGLPIWTGYEVLLLWCWANGYGPWAILGNGTLGMLVWLVVFGLALPLIHELHFYCIHRLIHLPKLYKWIHSVHHNSINPSPWSSLSMHPIEHLLYWSDSVIHLLLPSHPLLLLYHLQITGTGAVVGHVGFDRIETSASKAIKTHAYAHYLHHKYFEVNYADGALPLDKWMGTWHDGTPDGDRAMIERHRKRKAS